MVETSVHPGQLLLLEHSDNLRDWTETARALEHLHPYADALRGNQPLGFYRVRASPLEPADDWSNLIEGSSQKLFLPGSGSGLAGTSIVKWSILLNHPDRVYFQDSVRYPYHIQFARARLPGYAAMSTLDYYAQALYATPSQRMVLGSVLRAPNPLVRELAIEITGTEAFPATNAVNWIEAVKRRLVLEPGWRVYYMPATEQRAETEAHLALFAARGLEIASLNRWTTVNSGYSSGWALGQLVYLPAAEIQTALGDGRLRFEHILITDRVPAELPVLAGYLCLEPATPNSHVALLARSCCALRPCQRRWTPGGNREPLRS